MMFAKSVATFFLFLLIFLKIKFLDAQVANKTANQGGEITSVDSRFFDLGGRGMGYPNLREPGRNGNQPSNYPENSYRPNGNQNGNMQRPQSGFGWGPDGQYPNQGRPNQEGGRYPGNYPENYPSNRPDNYPSNRPDNYPSNRPDNYPDRYPGNQGNMRYPQNSNNYRPDDYNGVYRPGPNNNNMNQYPNNQQPPYYNSPPDRSEYPGNINNPYQNGGRPLYQDEYQNRPGDRPVGYPSQNGQYPSQGYFAGNQNQRPDGLNPDFRPEYPDDVLNTNVKFPVNNIPANQYPPNNTPYVNYPNNPNGNQGNINQDQGNYSPGLNQVFQGYIKGVPTSTPQMPNNRPIDSINGLNANGTATIPGKPVYIPSSNTPNGQVIVDGSTKSPSQKLCEQTCPSTPEYNPICGSNNVTYDNPGRFNCARNCKIAVNVISFGRCQNNSNQNNSFS